MSNDHSAAIEAGWNAYKNSWTPASPAARCEAAIRAAADVIEADVRRKIAEEAAETFEEWRVTGKPGHGFPDYDFAWSPDRMHDEPEAAARKFIELMEPHGAWEDGPHLSRRTVIRTAWAAIARGDSGGQA